MKTTTNYGFKKPEPNDPYNVNDINESFDIIDAELKAAAEKADTSTTHPSDMGNPHQTTAEQVGLGNVPNVSTNDQTPTYTIAAANETLSSGEKLSVAFGKIAKAVSSLISHIADTVGHITSTERTNWNDANSKKHSHSNKTVLDATTASYTTAEQSKLSGIAAGANAYTHPNSGVTAGTYHSVTVNAAGHVTAGSNPTVTVAQGGTGATTVAAARNALGLGNTTGAVPVANGGTGATTAKAALTNLGTVAVVVSATAPSDTTAVWIVPS